MGRHESFDPTSAIPFSLGTVSEALPAAGSPEALEAFGAACRAVDAAGFLNEADYEALRISPTGFSLWTSDRATEALAGNFSRFLPREIEAARATPRARLEELQILALRRELRMAEAAHSSRFRELHALVYGDEPDPADEDEAPASGEPDPIFALIEANRAAEAVMDAQSENAQLTEVERAEHDAAVKGQMRSWRAAFQTPPTTLAGIQALRDWITWQLDRHGESPEGDGTVWADAYLSLHGALDLVLKPASPDPLLVAMVTEWQATRSKLNDPDLPDGPEADAMSERDSTLQREIYRYPARSALDLLAKVPVFQDELADALRGYSGLEIAETLPGAAWTGLFADFKRMAGTVAAHADDAELIALGQRFDALHALWREADKAEEGPAARRDAALEAAKAHGGPTIEDIRAAWALPGVDEAVTRSDNAYGALEAVTRQIAATSAHTVQGFAVKARTLIPAVWPLCNYEQNAGLGENEDWTPQVVRWIVEALCTAAGVDWRGQPQDAAPAIADTTGADAQLIALGRAFDAATVRDREANDALNAAEDRAEPQMPERPAALIYREDDNLFPLREYGDAFAGIAVSPSDIEWMTRRPAQREVWVDNPRAQPGISMVPGKKPRIVHWPEAQARIDEIVAAWDAWHAEQDRVQDEAGVTEARDATADTSDAAAALARQIAEQPARTAEGMRVKLRVAAFYCVCDPDTPEGEGYPGEAAIRSLYRDTPGIEISTDPSDVRIVPEA